MGDGRRAVGRYAGLAVVLALVLAGAWLLAGRPADAGITAVDGAGSTVGAVPEVGKPAPDFTATTLDGTEVSLSAFAGRPVWLTFGASWCSSCRSEFPDIQGAFEAAPDDAVVLAVYLSEDAAAVRSYTERVGMTFTHVPDPEGRVAAGYNVIGVPMHYFIDRDGVVRSLRFGVLTRDQMDAALAEISG